MRRSAKGSVSIALAVLLVTAVSCTGSDTANNKSDDSAAMSTTQVPDDPAPYAAAGPDKVGFTERKLPDGRRVVIWYPSTAAATEGAENEQIDVSAFLSPELQAKIPAEDRTTYSADAFRDVAPRKVNGGHPVVLFSHGFAGFPEQSVSLTTHLASWGYVVAAPEHVERSLAGMLGTASQGVTRSTDQAVLSATLDLVQAESKSSGSLLAGMVDPERTAVTGHSAGASATFRTAAADARIDGWIAYSISHEQGGPNDEPLPASPETPGMVQLGTKDGVIPPESSEATFKAMNSPKYQVTIADAGHLVFSDICLIGADKGGIVSIAKTLELPIPETLLKLGTDGCGDGYPPVNDAFPAINQTSVAFLRWVFGQDQKPIGLSTEAVADLGADVTVTEG